MIHPREKLALFQSTHSLRSATSTLLSHLIRETCFNPRTPCGVRLMPNRAHLRTIPFQSTHSLRSATGELGTDDPNPTVSIHALLAECDLRILQGDFHHVRFNPRTPCGVRRHGTFCPPLTTLFQSTHSLRSATGTTSETINQTTVSIHALLAECDNRKK